MSLAKLRIDRFERLVLTPDAAASLVASGCDCGDGTPEFASSFAVADPEAPASAVTWSGTIVIEGQMTGDGRYIDPNALRWENLPLPLRYAPVDTGGHDGAQVVGRILTIERASDGQILATGDIDMRSELGPEAARALDPEDSSAGSANGVSVDLDSVSFEIRIAAELMQEINDDLAEDPPTVEPVEPGTDDEGRVTVVEINADDEVMATTDARIRAATIVAIPAFIGARLILDAPLSQALAASAFTITPAEDVPSDATCLHDGCTASPVFSVTSDNPLIEGLYCAEHAPEHEDQPLAARSIVAASFAVEPPAAWFEDPQLDGPTPITITEDGRIFGHLAVWGTCHTAYSGQCVEPPHSATGYAYFRTGSLLTREGTEVAVGGITLDTMHAGRTLSATDTLAHYEHTGRRAADVAAGEDAYGIWIAGSVRSMSDEKLRSLRAAPLSGDWRRVGGNLELVAALAVNSPGFPVPRPQGLVASGGVMVSLVASGMIAPRTTESLELSPDDLRYLKQLAARERKTVQTEAEALAARVRTTKAAALARRVGVR